MDDAAAPAFTIRPSGERRSRQVLEAAEQCVRRMGFHNASMAEIAAEAGMSVGHIYRYFPNKEAIIVALVERDAAQAMRDVEELERDPGCVRTALLAHCRRMIDRCASPGRAALILEVMAEAARNPRVAQVVRDGFGKVQARMFALVNCDRARGCSEADLRRRMHALDLILAGLPMKAIKSPDFDREAMAELAADCISKMLAD